MYIEKPQKFVEYICQCDYKSEFSNSIFISEAIKQ